MQIQPLVLMDDAFLQYWLTHFIIEIRKQNGLEYPPNTLHHLVCGILRFLRQNRRPEVAFFIDASFQDFCNSLDVEMKRLQSAGLGSKRKQAEPLTTVEEEELWNKKVLEDHNPQTLLNTVIVMVGLYFALCSGDKHRQLRHSPCQIQLIEKLGERPYLIYTEDTSKNNPGGLKGQKYRPKVVPHYSNLENPSWYFVCIFEKYNPLCPVNRPNNAFYLTPLAKPSDTCWFSCTPIDGTSSPMLLLQCANKLESMGSKQTTL